MVETADIAGASRIADVAAVLAGALLLSACSTSGPASGGTSFVEGALAPGRNSTSAASAFPRPQVDAIATGSIGAPGVFHSVAIPIRNFPVSARWEHVSRQIEACAAGSCDGHDDFFERIAAETEGRPLVEKAGIVNAAVNAALLYKNDRALYGELDHWATPQESLARGSGDCEDFAILKMAALIRAGVPANSLSLVVLRDGGRGVYHAVLAVATGSGSLILDNTRSAVAMDTELPDYQPLFSLGPARSWIHGTRMARAPVLVQDAAMSTIAPGEGSEASAGATTAWRL
jgi:predicted transglutaminase-like cysteine proteinase